MAEWVKCHRALTKGEKRGLTRAARFLYLELCLEARELDGHFRLPKTMPIGDAIADLVGGNRAEIGPSLDALRDEGMIDCSDGCLKITGWEKWAKADSSVERTRRWRAAKDDADRDVTPCDAGDVTVTGQRRGEESREDLTPTPTAGAQGFTTPDAEVVHGALVAADLPVAARPAELVATAERIAKRLKALAPEDRWQDLAAEATEWAATTRKAYLGAKDAGQHWGADRFLAEVEAKATQRARYRPKDARLERERARVASTSQKRAGGTFQGAESAIDWATVRADAKDADDRQARRAAQAIRERDGVDPTAMAGAVAASLEKFRPRPS